MPKTLDSPNHLTLGPPDTPNFLKSLVFYGETDDVLLIAYVYITHLNKLNLKTGFCYVNGGGDH